MPKPRVLHDQYFKKAKAEGYAARSAYKLIEINEKKGLIHPGDYVLDLGCAPGSWMQVVEELIGDHGRGVGIDLQPVRQRFGPNIRIIQGDAFSATPESLMEVNPSGNHRKFDVVLSDMAPNTSGHGDDFLSARLCERVLDLCMHVLRPGGSMVMKILEGEPTPDVIARAKKMFNGAGTIKPAASRDISREIFIGGRGFRG